jgi:DNA-binding NarL/FixJ family response regulator
MSDDLLKTAAGRLTEKGVKRILELRQAGKTYQAIAIEMNVSMGTVFNAVRGKTHPHLTRPASPAQP